MPFRKPSILTPEGESGEWKRVQGRHIFVPTTDASAEEVGEQEIERWEHPYPAYKDEDGGDDAPKKKFQSVEDNLNVRNIHADGAKEGEVYIGAPQKKDKLPDKNKISDVQLMDKIKYFVNGKEGIGTVFAMSNEFFTVRKESGGYQDIHITDVFFVDSIIVENKSWAHMDTKERVEILQKGRCPLSYVTRTWEDMPEEAKKVIKSNFEQGRYGGVDTSIHFDTTDDYEAVPIIDDESNFKHDSVKPTTSTDEPEQIPDSHKKPEVENKIDHSRSMVVGIRDKEEDEEEDHTSVEDLDKGNQDESYMGRARHADKDKGNQDESYMGRKKKTHEEEELEKENSSSSTSDVGSFNSVHNSRFNSDDKENKIGLAKSNHVRGIGYGITKLEEE